MREESARGKKVASTAITTTFTTTVVNINVQPQFQSVKSRPFITLPKYIPQENRCAALSRGKVNKQKSRSTSLATDENQYIYSYDKLVTEPALAYC